MVTCQKALCQGIFLFFVALEASAPEARLAAPTACNFQPQRIKVIDDDTSRAALGRVVPSRYYVSSPPT